MKQQQQSRPRAFLVDPQLPVAGGIAQVVPEGDQQGRICAEGTASRQDGNAPDPVMVFARIYPGQVNAGDPTVPDAPPGDAVMTPPAGQDWTFARVPGAAYAAGPPLPWSTLVVWAQFQDPTNPYDRAFTPFQGLQAAATDCGT